MTTDTRHTKAGWALVTGAGQRLGRHIADSLAQAGYAVALHYNRSADGAAEAAARINQGGGRAVTVQADLMQTSAARSLLSRVLDQLGEVTRRPGSVCLINNAAIFEHDKNGPGDDVWQAHMSVNLVAPQILAEQFVGWVRTHDAGYRDASIINILDRAVVDPPTDFQSYHISKSALWAATRLMARTAAPDVRVNAVGPGPTICHPRQSAQHFDGQGAATPLARNPAPQEIADAVRFIAANRSLVGQLLLIDAGWHLL